MCGWLFNAAMVMGRMSPCAVGNAPSLVQVLIPQTELALRGSNGVGFNGGLWFVGQRGRVAGEAAGERFVLQFTIFGDTDLQKHVIKSSVFGTFCTTCNK